MTIQPVTAIPTTITEKNAWLEARYWRFGMDDDLEDQLFDLFEIDDKGAMTAQPRVDPLTGESRGLMVLGRSGDGKTALLKRMLRVNPVLTEVTETDEGNTLYITVPPEATIKKLAELILVRTGYQRVDAKIRSADAWEMVMHRLSKFGIRAIIIDECHHIFRRGSGRDVAGAIQSLKHIMQSAGGVALVIAGVPGLRAEILSEESGETARRFQEFYFGDIQPGGKSASEFARNFAYCVKTLGLSVPEGSAMVERILFAQHGQIGRSVELGKLILADAVTRKRTQLSLNRAEVVYRKTDKCIGMTPFQDGDWETVQRELQAIGWGL
ncbi:TniB family NTP-binding protein [Phaeobacter gallaeciensis]|uniref:TniB family NTP-binding protein n=1 Tax=Phaeobacter gallaeciensis TaxID=60890 RepID=UPI00237FF6BF|nr:TniB family NTP-binding protein [Phaeobacter gallaeciensis]MDE4276771.1 TniB family NTP-binding protein [Phaeobacter gallaeciensis]MDE4302000.1 TniB family NTP-binding protein [Phaeobacter gallaeciensis]MDE5187195.1 TniB family NTP-binding protein [Phaeobacter gallaeciensis]